MRRTGRPPSEIKRVVDAILGDASAATRARHARRLLKEAAELNERARHLVKTARLLGGGEKKRQQRRKRSAGGAVGG